MKKTFFEYLGIADMEKIHSQILSWIFSKDNDALLTEQKNKLIEGLFSVKDCHVVDIITEYESIDILIVLDKFVLCIENKLKSSEHSNQLIAYQNTLTKQYPNTKVNYYFLTLAGEEATSTEWINISYSDLYKELKKLTIENNGNGIILQEYIQTLSNYSLVVSDFINNPTKYKNVFLDGHKKKAQKNIKNNDPLIQFVTDNQLETILQKLYFRKVAQHLKLNSYYITETHGNAILGVGWIEKLNYNGKDFYFGFDFQKGTFKTNLTTAEYHKSQKDDIPEELGIALGRFKDEEGGKKYEYKRFNRPKSKAQYSITKKTSIKIEDLMIADFAKIFDLELSNAQQLLESFITKFNNNNKNGN